MRQRAAARLASLRARVAAASGGGKDAMRDLIEEDHRLALAGTAPSSASSSSSASATDSWLIPGLAIAPPPVINRVSLPRVGDSDGIGSNAVLTAVPVDTPLGFVDTTR